MSTSDKDFCPACGSLLQPFEEDGVLLMRCTDCAYSTEASSYSAVHFTKRGGAGQQAKGGVSGMDPNRVADIIHDKTYQRTMKIKCINPKCTGQTEIVLITSNKHPERGYICASCHTTWGRL